MLDRILDDENRPDGGDAKVAVDVLAVLDQFHDREQNIGAAAPGEGPVDSFGLGATIGLVEPGPVKDDHDDRQAGMGSLHLPAEVGRVHIGQIAGDEDEIEVFLRQDAQPFLAGQGGDNLRDVLEVQQLGRAVNILRQRVIARDAEGLVRIRDHQDRAHTPSHQVVEATKLRIVGVAELVAKVRRLHRRLVNKGLRIGACMLVRPEPAACDSSALRGLGGVAQKRLATKTQSA